MMLFQDHGSDCHDHSQQHHEQFSFQRREQLVRWMFVNVSGHRLHSFGLGRSWDWLALRGDSGSFFDHRLLRLRVASLGRVGGCRVGEAFGTRHARYDGTLIRVHSLSDFRTRNRTDKRLGHFPLADYEDFHERRVLSTQMSTLCPLVRALSDRCPAVIIPRQHPSASSDG